MSPKNPTPTPDPVESRIIRVCLVEDDAPLRKIIGDWLRCSDDIKFAGEYGDAESAITGMPKDQPHVVLMDINLPGQSGIDCVRQLKPLLPATQFVMVTVYQDTDNIFQALAAGATGYLLKQATRATLLRAVRDAHQGGSPISSYIARKVVQVFQHPAPKLTEGEKLSPREQKVLELLAEGHMLKEIAKLMGLSIHTVNTFTRRIYEKLHVHSRSQAVAHFSAQSANR